MIKYILREKTKKREQDNNSLQGYQNNETYRKARMH